MAEGVTLCNRTINLFRLRGQNIPVLILNTISSTVPSPSAMLQNNNEELLPLEEIEQNHIQLVLVRLSGNDSRAAKVRDFLCPCSKEN
jgi:hypothetical protein